ncbi:hypothetical protein IV102_12410 [bacterium]|nr:hypothetical protein [bacterium]
MFAFLRKALQGQSPFPDLKVDHWDYHAGFSHPRWRDVAVVGRAAWTALVRSWLNALRQECGPDYRLDRNDHFFLLSPLKAHQARLQLDFFETTYQKLTNQLSGLTSDRPQVVLVLLNTEYQRYLSHWS